MSESEQSHKDKVSPPKQAKEIPSPVQEKLNNPYYYEVNYDDPKPEQKIEKSKRSSSSGSSNRSDSRDRSRDKKNNQNKNSGNRGRDSTSSHRHDHQQDRFRRNDTRPRNDSLPKEEFYKKTKMCPQYEKGLCRKGHECNFAHNQSELRGLPDFRKTKLCIAFKEGKCGKPSSECKYAHGEGELRRIGNHKNDRDKRHSRSPYREKERHQPRQDYMPPPYNPYPGYPPYPPYMNPMYPGMMGSLPPTGKNPSMMSSSSGRNPQPPTIPPYGNLSEYQTAGMPPPGHPGGYAGGYYPPYDYYGSYGPPGSFGYPPNPPKPPM